MTRQTLTAPATRRSRRRAPGFSIMEMLVALTISSTLLAATLVALDAMFKRYTVISDSCSTHVVARVTMHRILTMIRTGTEFGPFPADVLDTAQNPANYDHIQFVSVDDPITSTREITTIERRASGNWTSGGTTVQHRGPFTLWIITSRSVAGGTPVVTERPLLDGILAASFNLEYDIGPRLRRATVDLTIQPQGNTYSKFDSTSGTWSVSEWDNTTNTWKERRMSTVEANSPTIRLIASTGPRSEF
ncbi:MAG: PulJ/GspJ family protein [Phycisphaerales bacterium]